ncbi:hypothetical protein [Amycolatopsis sp. lyj-109]|uniref:hypothetical protein n=1 Tax=Amycolatopsis sp. lyj-109 TaxID=2789287 RepID=UPI00397B2C36
MTEYFDVGQSRSIPWKRRPEATRLLAAMRSADRGFDAVVIGEPQLGAALDAYTAGSPRRFGAAGGGK